MESSEFGPPRPPAALPAPAALPPPPDGDPDRLAPEIARATDYAEAAQAAGTIDVYRRVWGGFTRWCRSRQVVPLPADPLLVAAFLAGEADRGLAVASVQLAAAAIASAHLRTGHTSPTAAITVRQTLAGIRRVKARPKRPKTALVPGPLINTVDRIPDDLRGARDRAILLFGFAGAFRRSELVALEVEDLYPQEAGLLVMVRRSKSDQEAQGALVPVVRGEHHCPIQAVQAWLAQAGITEGPIFRPIRKGGAVVLQRLNDRTIARIVKARAAAAGLDPALFAGHSLRSGFLTAAAAKRASIWKMAEVSRHKSLDVLRGYVQPVELFDDHAGTGLL